METESHIGVKRAASKRLSAELGIASTEPTSFAYKKKILYRKLSPSGIFGESEVDYILLNKMNEKEKSLITPNPDEVEQHEWIAPGPVGNRTSNLVNFLESERARGFPPTPWFDLMVTEPTCLESWWSCVIEDEDFIKADSGDISIKNFFLQ